MAESTIQTLTTDGAASNDQYEDRREATIGYIVQRNVEVLIRRGEYLGKG